MAPSAEHVAWFHWHITVPFQGCFSSRVRVSACQSQRCSEKVLDGTACLQTEDMMCHCGTLNGLSLRRARKRGAERTWTRFHGQAECPSNSTAHQYPLLKQTPIDCHCSHCVHFLIVITIDVCSRLYAEEFGGCSSEIPRFSFPTLFLTGRLLIDESTRIH